MASHAKISVGDLLELEIERFAHRGFGVARTSEGQVVFVSDTMPGETVRAMVIEVKKKFLFAKTVDVLEASPNRVEHFWSDAALAKHPNERAGGADLGHVELSYQRKLKQDVLFDALTRFGKLEAEAIPVLFTESEQGVADEMPNVIEPLDDEEGAHWRTRIRLRADEDGNLGVFARRTNYFVPITSYPLATQELLQDAPLGQQFEGIQTLDIIASSTGQVRLVIDDLPSSRTLNEKVVWQKADGSSAEFEFALAENGFWQVHHDAPRALATTVAKLLDANTADDDALHLDLYAGVGLFTAVLASELGANAKIHSVEMNTGASKFAEENLSDYPNVEIVASDVLRYLRQLHAEKPGHVGTVLLDPPRTGSGKKVVEEVAKLSPVQVIYVACDPVALSRDIHYFVEHGYRVDALRALDLFPHTYHFETIARLVRE